MQGGVHDGEVRQLIDSALERQRRGDIDGAVRLYRQSLSIEPTAEGHTFLGWALSHQGEIDAAIDHCRRAVVLDPAFGNPYNDIGVYLMHKGELDQAIWWFERAIRARRYEPRHFPHVNLARIHARRGRQDRALHHLCRALEYDPDNRYTRRLLHRLRGVSS